MEIKANNIDDIYLKVIKDVLENGFKSSPRSINVVEKLGYQFTLTDPRNCLVTLKERKMNYKFAIIEKMEYVSGVSSAERICHYNKNYKNYVSVTSDEVLGAYGPRLRRQYDYVYDLLKKDPETRQAIMNINNEKDKDGSGAMPCTISLQFLNRQGQLHLIATMRSNDVFYGLPYDVNGFCFIQQMMASWLGLELGSYIHQAGSMHIYADKIDSCVRMFANQDKVDIQNPVFDLPYEETRVALNNFSVVEYDKRKNHTLNNEYFMKLPQFLKDYVKMI